MEKKEMEMTEEKLSLLIKEVEEVVDHLEQVGDHGELYRSSKRILNGLLKIKAGE